MPAANRVVRSFCVTRRKQLPLNEKKRSFHAGETFCRRAVKIWEHFLWRAHPQLPQGYETLGALIEHHQVTHNQPVCRVELHLTVTQVGCLGIQVRKRLSQPSSLRLESLFAASLLPRLNLHVVFLYPTPAQFLFRRVILHRSSDPAGSFGIARISFHS